MRHEQLATNDGILERHLDLIVSHKAADFDALSSLVAAKKLYPDSRLLLPGSQEKSVRNFMSLFKDKIKIEDEKTCRLDDINRLVIVDNRHRSRIGIAGDLAGKKNMEIHIYDHHPRTRFDIKAHKDVFKEVGATVSIILEILLKEGKFDFTPLEATLMLIGIYEETGSLSFRTTTKLDVDMVSKLLEMGANLNAVSLYLNRELEGDEMRALIELLESTEVVNVGGINVAFSVVDASKFAGETGTVVHKLQEIENYPVLFAMFTAKERVKVLGRSRTRLVDLNRILGYFGGAGHSSAASARFEGRSVEDIKIEIVKALERELRPDVTAKDIMSYPVVTVSEDEKVTEVLERLVSLGYKGVPVLDEVGKLVGMVTEGNLKTAIMRHLGHSRVKGYMNVNLVTAAPDTPLHILEQMMREKDKGRLPIIQDGKLVGIVTRNDVLRKVHSSLFPEKKEKRAMDTHMSAKMKKALPERLVAMIRWIGSQGDAAGMNVFLVGGFVRDLLLGVRNYDLDIVVEGDAIEFGRTLSRKFGGALVVHKKFGTATIVMKWPSWLGKSIHHDNKFKIDVATARKEKYEEPAALPVVEFSSLRHDLYRRDFTINAMAIKINRTDFGLFVDFFGGITDLEKGSIRVLHDKSFIDDPTRIFRAVRFEQRFGFAIEKHTEYLIQHAIKQEMFRRVENQRIRDELILMLNEKTAEKAVYRMKDLHELRFIHPDIVLRRAATSRLFKEVDARIKWYNSNAVRKRGLDVWLINFFVLIDELTFSQSEEVLAKFVFSNSVNNRVHSLKKNYEIVLRKLSSSKKLLPSEMCTLLEKFSHEAMLYIMAKTRSRAVRGRIMIFFKRYNGMCLRITGDDIKKEGVPTGPDYKKILDGVLREKLDGKLPTKLAEIKFMRKIIGDLGIRG